MNLTSLKFDVETTALEKAVGLVDKLHGSVANLNKPLKTMGDSATKAATSVEDNSKAVDDNTKSVKRNQSVLERQEDILKFMGAGFSKGQSSILAMAKASGALGDELTKLGETMDRQRKLQGSEPFDKSIGAIKVLKNELGALREAYRQTLATEKAAQSGESFAVLSTKQSRDLYREKFRLIEQFKDQTNTEVTTYSQLKAQLRSLNTEYITTAKSRNLLAGVNTVQQTKRSDELRYLARATSVQLGDIGVSLAGGQNPLTVFVQQADQLRGVFAQVGADAAEMDKALAGAFGQIVAGFRDVAFTLIKFVGTAFVEAGKWVANFAASLTGIPQLMNALINGTTIFGKEIKGIGADSGFANFLKAFSPALIGAMTFGVLGLASAAIAVGVAYAKILPVQKELNAALIQNGASLATSAKDAMQMSAAMAGASGTSLDYAKVITEIASAGNLSKDSIQGITNSAVEMNRYLGTATKDVVAQYSKLADDPVKALTEIGMATGRVTSATIDHIKNLVEQGRKTEAVAEANRELDRAYAEMSASAKNSMTPLSRLWDEIKGGANNATEAVYSFAQTDSVVTALTTVWRGLASVINLVVYGLKEAGRIAGGTAAAVGAYANTDSIKSLLTRDVANPALAAASKQAAATLAMMNADQETNRKAFVDSNKEIWNPSAIKATTSAQQNYISEVKNGVSVTRLATQTELDAQKAVSKGISLNKDWEKQKEKYSTASRLDSKARVEAANKEKAAVKALFEEQKKSLIGQGVRGEIKPEAAAKKLNSLKQDLDSFNFAIDEKYKPKKAAGGDSAARDELSSKQQLFENERKQAERNAKTRLADLDTARNLELVNSRMYIDEKYAIDKEYIEASLGTLKDELKIAYEKKKSLKEIAEYKGKIEAEEYKLNERKLERDRAIAEHSGKAAIEMRNAAMQEIATLVEKNKAQKLDNELIGKTQEEIAGIKAARLDHVIALQQEHVEYMKKNGYNETSSTAYGLEKQKLDALIESRKLNVDALNREITATLAKNSAASEKSFIKESNDLDNLQKDLYFREQLLGKTKEQKEEMQRGYAIEKQLRDNKFKAENEINELLKERNRLLALPVGSDQAAAIEADYQKSVKRVNDLTRRQGEIITSGADLAKKELQDAELEKFSAGIADALVTGMTQGAKAGKKKLRDLIVAELTKTITLNIQANIQSFLSGSSGGSSGGGIFDKILDKGIDYLTNSLFGGATGGTVASTAASTFGAVTGTVGTYGMSAAAGTGAAALAELTTGVATLGASAAAATGTTVAAGGGLAGLGNAALAALGPIGLVAGAAIALFAIFGMGSDEMPSVLNDLALFNNSLIGLPFLELAIGSDEAAQGLRDVLYGLENASPTMRKLAGETISLSKELLIASGDIAGARNLARNLETRGMSKAEIEVYDYNQSLRDQIDAARAGASAAREAAQAEEQLAKTRYDLAGKLNILLGRTTQKEFDRATQLAATSDEASLGMLHLIFQLEDLTAAVDASYATLERSIAAERKLADTRLQSAQALQTALKAAKESSTAALTRNQAQNKLVQFLNAARTTGSLPTAESIAPTLSALAEPSEGLFTTFVDYQRDFLRTANDINDMSYLADKQVSMEQQTIDKLDAQLLAAKAQLDALKGVDTSVKDVTTAVNDFNAAMQALAGKQATTGSYSFAAPSGGGGYGGGGGSSGGSSTGGAPKYEDIVGQSNKDIVLAYREYYNRNPDESGYDYFSKSLLKGDKLMQAILGASSGNPESADYKTAVSKGYDPTNPLSKYLKSETGASSPEEVEGSFAVGINNVPRDMNARIHKGERILPAADNAELFARLRNPDENAAVLAAAVERLTKEVEGLRVEQRQTVTNTGDTSKMLRRFGSEGDALNVKVQV